MYQILRVYDDQTAATERTDVFTHALSACAIYLEDPSCISVKIWDVDTGKIILDYWRENA